MKTVNICVVYKLRVYGESKKGEPIPVYSQNWVLDCRWFLIYSEAMHRFWSIPGLYHLWRYPPILWKFLRLGPHQIPNHNVLCSSRWTWTSWKDHSFLLPWLQSPWGNWIFVHFRQKHSLRIQIRAPIRDTRPAKKNLKPGKWSSRFIELQIRIRILQKKLSTLQSNQSP